MNESCIGDWAFRVLYKTIKILTKSAQLSTPLQGMETAHIMIMLKNKLDLKKLSTLSYFIKIILFLNFPVREKFYNGSSLRSNAVNQYTNKGSSITMPCKNNVTILPVHGTLYGPSPVSGEYFIVYCFT